MLQSRRKLMVKQSLDDLQHGFSSRAVAQRVSAARGASERRGLGGQPNKPEGHHLREAESRRCPADDARGRERGAMMWELLGEGRRLLEDGEWRRQPPRLA